uniref:Uncharacterized protein n=1 Tax=Anguilla anguilla TaxID=7936 RepID=A0A0E9U5G9_ANGAN
MPTFVNSKVFHGIVSCEITDIYVFKSRLLLYFSEYIK